MSQPPAESQPDLPEPGAAATPRQPEPRTITLSAAHHLQALHDTAPVSLLVGAAIAVLLIFFQVLAGSRGVLQLAIQALITAVLIIGTQLVIALINRPSRQRVRTYFPEGGEVTVVESDAELLLLTPGGELRYDLATTRGRPLKLTLRLEPAGGPRLAIPRALLTARFLRRFDP